MADKQRIEKPCSLCKAEGIEPPALGSKATGSYIREGTWDFRHTVFNGYVCEMHASTISWNKLTWK